MLTVEDLGRRAREAAANLGRLGSTQKEQGLKLAAQALLDGKEKILEANAQDVKAAREKGMKEGLSSYTYM